jgi:hypothetical protein
MGRGSSKRRDIGRRCLQFAGVFEKKIPKALSKTLKTHHAALKYVVVLGHSIIFLKVQIYI